ncbi:MAG: hypothetical protein AAGE52_39370 [Myxococcota bacterium]
MSAFPEATGHGSFEEIFPNVFAVWSHFTMAPTIRITRNMIVVREGEDLTLINGVRLSARGEEELAGLGKVKHLVRIGAFHGIDEPYLLDRYKPTYWKQDGQRGRIEADQTLAGGNCPIDASVIELQNTRKPEAALLLPIEGGLMVTCDAIQNIVDTQHCSAVAKVVTRTLGFVQPAGIAKTWRKAMTKDAPLQDDFRRLYDQDFRHLITGHGAANRDSAKADLRGSIKRVFGVEL